MATDKNHKGIFKKILVDFIGQENPILPMLEWTAQQMMQIEAETKVGARKEEHSEERHRRFEEFTMGKLQTKFDMTFESEKSKRSIFSRHVYVKAGRWIMRVRGLVFHSAGPARSWAVRVLHSGMSGICRRMRSD